MPVLHGFDDDELIGAAAAARELHTSLTTLHSWCLRRLAGELDASPPFFQIGRKRMFKYSDVIEWLEKQEQ